MLLTLPRISPLLSLKKWRIPWFDLLLFFFFFTLHADQLNLVKGGFSIRLNNLIALFLLVFCFFRFKSKIFAFDKRFLKGIALLTGSILLSLYFSPFRARCVVFFGWYGLTLLGYVFLPYLLVTHFSTKRAFQLYLSAFLAVGAYAALQLFLSFFGIRDPFAAQTIAGKLARPNAFAYEPSYYALYMTPFVMMANLHFLLDKKKDFFVFKALNKKILAVINAFFVLSATSSALFAYFVFIAVLGVFRILSFKLLLKLVLWTFMCLLGLCLAFPGVAKVYVLKFFFQGLTSHHSFFERWVGIENCWKVFLEHPLLGVGLGGTPSYLYEAWANQNPCFNFVVQNKLAFLSLKSFEPTNVFIETLSSLGLIGVSGFVALFWSYGQAARKAFLNEEKRHWVILFCVATLVTFIVLQFNQGLFRTYIWTHFSLTFAFFSKE